MDLKSLLNEINTVEKYGEQGFNSCKISPSMFWSSALSISSSDTVVIPRQKTRAQQQTRKPWTLTEDFLLEKGYLQGLSWAMISTKYLPHRSRGCCWGRFKTLRKKMAQRKNWDINEDKILLVSIKKRNRIFKQAWRSGLLI